MNYTMNYIIKFAKKLGENTFDIIFFNNYEDIDKWQDAISRLCEVFKKSGITSSITYYGDEYRRIAYIEY